MANTTRPTTTMAVQADLKARAASDMKDCYPYLLGMCSALLAQANTELSRLEKRNAELVSALEVMEQS